MATTVERPIAPHVVAHATEYPADRDGGGTGQNRQNSSKDSAESHETDVAGGEETPAVLVDRLDQNHFLDGVEAYKATALSVLEPGIEHGPVHPLSLAQGKVPAYSVQNAYTHAEEKPEPHKVNVAT